MAADVRSLFVVGEAILPHSKTKQTLSRLVVSEDRVWANDELDRVRETGPEPCCCAWTWLSAMERSNGRCWRIRTTPAVFSGLVFELKKSQNFRIKILGGVRARIADPGRDSLAGCLVACPGGHLRVEIAVAWRGSLPMDLIGNCCLETLVRERIELDEMLACLSTLGGAFSSMGDQHLTCAETAGRISLHQMRIAARLGDAVLVAKCRLFLALSLMQRGRLRGAERIIRAQYDLAKGLPDARRDGRLENMCKGAWAKLQYIHGQRRMLAKRPKINSDLPEGS